MGTTQVDAIKQTAREAQNAIKPKTIEIPAYNSKTRKMETREQVIRSGKEGNSFKRIVLISAFIVI